jgi:hypothetical protein
MLLKLIIVYEASYTIWKYSIMDIVSNCAHDPLLLMRNCKALNLFHFLYISILNFTYEKHCNYPLCGFLVLRL